MGLVAFLDQIYANLLSVFPTEIHWFVSLALLVALVVGLWNLVRVHWGFLILAIILFPFLIPVLKTIFTAFYHFGVGIFNNVQSGVPK